MAAATGVVALATALNLDSIASKERLFWFWLVPGTHLPGASPWQNFVSWFLFATAIAFLLRNPGAKRDVWEDMKVVRDLLRE